MITAAGRLPGAASRRTGPRDRAPTHRSPFAIVIVASLISRLFIGFFVNPVLYQMVAREGDVLHNLQVQLFGMGNGTVVSDIGGINCPGTCSANHVQGAVVTLTETPASDSLFSSWNATACSGSGSQCVVTMDNNQTVGATFNLINGPPPPQADFSILPIPLLWGQ
jgi:hypothetical protein